MLEQADEVLTNSHFTAGLVSRHARVQHLRVTGVGLSLSRLGGERRRSPWASPSLRRDRRRAMGLAEGPLFAYIGRLTDHKRVDRMLRICAEMQDATCVIAGEGPAGQALAACAADLGISSRCRFPGRIGEAEKWALLRAANFSFLMSEFDPRTGACEGFGIGLLEAAAAGALPVSSGADGMADFMLGPERPGVVLPVAPLDARASAALLSRLLADEAAMDGFVLRGRRMISNRYNWSSVARMILSPRQQVAPSRELRDAG
ncbi:MAG: glycosyltransferase [Pseudomonadota bacterium]